MKFSLDIWAFVTLVVLCGAVAVADPPGGPTARVSQQVCTPSVMAVKK